MPITITDSDGTVRSTNWPPADKPVMLDQVADAKRKADQDVYDAKKAASPLQSYSNMHAVFGGRMVRKDNTTGETEVVDV